MQISVARKSRFDQSEFLNAIIHEIKNPLNAIIGLSQILREEKNYSVSDVERADYIKDINDTANDLSEIVHDLLEVNSQSSGNFSINLSEEIDIANLIRRSVKLNYDYSLMSNISIKTEISEERLTIRLDPKRMKQILANLISNAIKYSSEKTVIKVVAKNIRKKNKEYLQISVIDQGFGMTQEEVEEAFQKYKTIPNPNSGKVDSFGLGLPIVKQLVESQNGIIEIKSELNKGTEVIMHFPYLV